MGRRVTIDDVAREAGVHKATVSRALNVGTESQVSAATVRRVKKVAKQLGYMPNVVARGLRTSATMTIGVVIPDLMNPVFPPIIRGIESYLLPRGYTTLLANTDGNEDAEEAAFETMLQRRVDGFILATGRLDDQPALRRAHEQGVLGVLVNRSAGSAPYPVVDGSSAAGIKLAVDHLVSLGHRHIVHFAGPVDFSTTLERREAFRRAAAEYSDLHAEVIEAGALSAAAGESAMKALLDAGRPLPTAVVAGNDLVALGILRSLRARGLRCPEDMSVTGFNDMPFAADFAPSLTTVRVPLHDLGVEAARLLLQAISDGRQDPVQVTLPVTLSVRGSTAKISR